MNEMVVSGWPYLLLGIDALRSADRAAAERFLTVALQMDPAGSDALYYLARASAQLDVQRSISLLSHALGNARFERATEAGARLELASLLVRVGRYEEALRVLDGLSAADAGRVEPFRLAAAAHLGLGRQEAALSVIEAGMRRHPTDARLHVLRAHALKAGGFPVKEVLDTAAVVVPGDPTIAAERALAALAEGAFRLEDHLAASEQDPRVSAEAFAAAPDAARLERFFSAGGNQRVDLLVRVGTVAARDPVLKTRFDEKVQGFSGRRWIDENGDSLAEELYQYEGGVLTSWARDANQDLVPEVRFERGFLVADGVRYEFDPYPFLSRVSLQWNGATWMFDLPPRRVRGPFVEGAEAPGVERMRLAGNIPQEGTLAMVARAVTARDPGGGTRHWTLEAGVPAGLEEDSDGDGRPDHVLSYRAGRPASGQRDVDRDGIFDVVEQWSARGLSLLSVDLNHNGVADYTVDFERRVWLWDYNEDGVPERSDAAPDRGPLPDFLWPAIVQKGEGR